MHVNFFFTTFIFYDFNENPLQTTGLDTQAHQRVSDGHLIYVNEKQYIYKFTLIANTHLARLWILFLIEDYGCNHDGRLQRRSAFWEISGVLVLWANCM